MGPGSRHVEAQGAVVALPWRAAAVAPTFLVAYVLLDWASFIRPLQGLNITPWNPQAALAVGLLMHSGRWWWLVIAGVLAADVTVRGLSGSPWQATALAVVLAASYQLTATALRRMLPGALAAPRSMRDAAWLLVLLAAGGALAAAVYVGGLALAGLVPLAYDGFADALVRYWIGDSVGLLVGLPLLFGVIDPTRRAALAATLRHPQMALIALLTVGLLWLTFARQAGEPFKLFYLLLLPSVWAAARFGTAGAVLAAALVQVGMIGAVQAGVYADLTVFELQLLMAAIATTALLLGVGVDARARADAELRNSLRLAAAGQMSAALAHELSQPLTALASYAQACKMLAEGTGPLDDERRRQLADVSRRMAADARRAGDVVKRLRDFFRSGSTQLRREDPKRLVDEATAAQQRPAQALGVSLACDAPERLPEVWFDAVQLQVVLRNLLGNAIDAAAAAPTSASAAGGAARSVRVQARASAGGLRVDVHDSGGGVPREKLATLFDPGPSDKPGGMGVGLSICRAIVEAHGGRLWAEPGPGGHFAFTLPGAQREDADAP